MDDRDQRAGRVGMISFSPRETQDRIVVSLQGYNSGVLNWPETLTEAPPQASNHIGGEGAVKLNVP
jgi:hypothetical protein